ncbi:MAG: hypothetical protein ACLSA2_11080 [Candidatus Gastranaerophilaceae bacterium]
MKINYITPYNIQTPDKNLQLQTNKVITAPPEFGKTSFNKGLFKLHRRLQFDLAKTIERLDILCEEKVKSVSAEHSRMGGNDLTRRQQSR